jgi:hypothetical protein
MDGPIDTFNAIKIEVVLKTPGLFVSLREAAAAGEWPIY